MTNKSFFIFAITLPFLINGCSSIKTGLSQAEANFLNREAYIKCYSGGKLFFDSESDGKIFSAENSDGYVFIDKKDAKLKEVSGDCIINYK